MSGHPHMYSEHDGELNRVIYQNSQWAVTEFGLENWCGPCHYWIAWADIHHVIPSPAGWVDHMSGKNWVDLEAFSDAYRLAEKMKATGRRNQSAVRVRRPRRGAGDDCSVSAAHGIQRGSAMTDQHARAYDFMHGPAQLDTVEIAERMGIPERAVCELIYEERKRRARATSGATSVTDRHSADSRVDASEQSGGGCPDTGQDDRPPQLQKTSGR